MKNLSFIKKIAVKVGQDSDEALLFLTGFKNLRKAIIVEPGLTIYQLPGGTTLEFYGIGSHSPDYLFQYGKITLSYRVNNLEKSLTLLKSRGAILLGAIEYICADCCFCYLLLANNSVIGLYQDK